MENDNFITQSDNAFKEQFKKDKPKWVGSKMPMMRQITLAEIIEQVVCNKGSQCRSDELMSEVNDLIKIRANECRNLCNNIMNQLIEEVRSYE
jgi:hypothetical protein